MVGRVHVSTEAVDEDHSRLARAGLAALEVAYDCQLLAYIAQDDHGIYVTLRPGAERIIAERLYDMDWTAVFAEALQQYPA